MFAFLAGQVQWSCNAVERLEGGKTGVVSIWHMGLHVPAALGSFWGHETAQSSGPHSPQPPPFNVFYAEAPVKYNGSAFPALQTM